MSNSGVFVTPSTIAPAFFKRATSGASCLTTNPARRRVPASQRRPVTSSEPLMLMGTPCSGPSSSPLVTAASALRAARSAPSESTCTKAFSRGFNLSIFARWACTSSTAEIFFLRTCCAMAAAESKVRSSMCHHFRWRDAQGHVDRSLFVRSQWPRRALGQLAQFQWPNRDSHQPQHFHAKRSQHAANLPVLTFIENDFQPTIFLSAAQQGSLTSAHQLPLIPFTHGNSAEQILQELITGQH